VLGLPAIDWEERIMGARFPVIPPCRSIPSNPCPPDGGIVVPGNYTYPGYGTLTIVSFDDSNATHLRLLAHLPKRVNRETDTSYIGRFNDSQLFEWAVFTHFDGNNYDMTAASTYRDPLSADLDNLDVIVMEQPQQAVFLQGKVGFGSNFCGVWPDFLYTERDIAEKDDGWEGVDIWFNKY